MIAVSDPRAATSLVLVKSSETHCCVLHIFGDADRIQTITGREERIRAIAAGEFPGIPITEKTFI